MKVADRTRSPVRSAGLRTEASRKFAGTAVYSPAVMECDPTVRMWDVSTNPKRAVSIPATFHPQRNETTDCAPA